MSSQSAPALVQRFFLSGTMPCRFQNFAASFEEQSNQTSLHLLAQRADEAEIAVFIENSADKDVTALRYQRVMTAEDGKVRKHAISSDSYMVDVYHPVLRAGDRKLVCRGVTVDEILLDHVFGSGGMMVLVLGATRSLSLECLRFSSN